MSDQLAVPSIGPFLLGAIIMLAGVVAPLVSIAFRNRSSFRHYE